jgi:hypothetical protein
MGIEFIRESSRDAQYTVGEDDKSSGSRSWIAKADSPATSPADVVAATPVQVGDPFPGDSSLRCTRVRARANSGDGMLWTSTAEYEVRPAPDEEEPPDGPGNVPGKPPVWGGSSSVSSGPIYQDMFGDTITNTAGDPLEDLTADIAEERLTLTSYYRSHTDWMGDAKKYTNAINNGNWNGGNVGEWKCQGVSKKLNIEQQDGGTLIYWELTWEFAYRAGGWQPLPWNIGFHELVDENGDPDPYGGQRAVIKSHGGKGVRHPVALNNDGTAKPAGEKPDVIFVAYYKQEDFGIFGEVFTPGQ